MLSIFIFSTKLLKQHLLIITGIAYKIPFVSQGHLRLVLFHFCLTRQCLSCKEMNICRSLFYVCPFALGKILILDGLHRSNVKEKFEHFCVTVPESLAMLRNKECSSGLQMLNSYCISFWEYYSTTLRELIENSSSHYLAYRDSGVPHPDKYMAFSSVVSFIIIIIL